MVPGAEPFVEFGIVQGKREVPRGVRISKVRRQDKFRSHSQFRRSWKTLSPKE